MNEEIEDLCRDLDRLEGARRFAWAAVEAWQAEVRRLNNWRRSVLDQLERHDPAVVQVELAKVRRPPRGGVG